ncbi:hypothetical protein [Amycolatopsis cihanbeyliensis]|uniref:Uncharacterized protein n=1 Tax=Amycolatopsis cihanbeyliensis TaxID=1128664 RepID=A0A542DNN2_AMYCI|nr:hypothetical protein [Amycolatopsis cihanbeyliensis]TQJ04667.1 hypothetical protein FB471_4472 [Amycolatopsis cihanbeyliensis]
MASRTYRVTDAAGREVRAGDQVTSFRGEPATFLRVTRGTEYNGTARVLVRWQDGWEHDYYDRVFDLTVETVTDGGTTPTG